MSIVLTKREIRGVLVLEISGRLTVSDYTLRDAVLESLKDGHRQIVLKAKAISYIDSCGLGQLVSVYTSVRNSGGALRFLTPSEKVRALLAITKLDTVFDILDDESPFTENTASVGRKAF